VLKNNKRRKAENPEKSRRNTKKFIVNMKVKVLVFISFCLTANLIFARRSDELRQKAEHGDASAQNKMGDIYCGGNTPNYEEALKWYRKSAEQGNPLAQVNLGRMYERGYGLAQNYEEALKWYRKSAEKGDAAAQYNLGVMYCFGQGVAKNFEEARKWYRKAIEQGDVTAQTGLGAMYEKGYGMSSNRKTAIEWYRKAAKQGDMAAKRNLERLGARN
jgi:TPR repeat protein